MKYRIHSGIAGAALLSLVGRQTHEDIMTKEQVAETPFDVCAYPDWTVAPVGGQTTSIQQKCEFKVGLTQAGKNQKVLSQMFFNRPLMRAGDKMSTSLPGVEGNGVSFILNHKGQLKKKFRLPKAYLQQTILTSGWYSVKGESGDKQKVGKSPIGIAVTGAAPLKLAMKNTYNPYTLELVRDNTDASWVKENTTPNNKVGWAGKFDTGDLDKSYHYSPNAPSESMSDGYMWDDPNMGIVVAYPGNDREFTGNTYPKKGSNRAVERARRDGKFPLSNPRIYNVFHDSLNDSEDYQWTSIAGCVTQVSDTDDLESTVTDVTLKMKALTFSGLAKHATRLVWRDFFISYVLDNEMHQEHSQSSFRSLKDIWFSKEELAIGELQLAKQMLTGVVFYAGFGLSMTGAGSVQFAAGSSEVKVPWLSMVASLPSIKAEIDEAYIAYLYKQDFNRNHDDWHGAQAENNPDFDCGHFPKSPARAMLGGKGATTWVKDATGVVTGAASAFAGHTGRHSSLDGIRFVDNDTCPAITCEGAVVNQADCELPGSGWTLLVGYTFGIVSQTLAGFFQNGIEDDPYDWNSHTDFESADYICWFFGSVPDNYREGVV